MNWLDELSDNITEMLANPKLVKFNTHKNRKAFTNQLMGMIKDAINKNTVTQPQNTRKLDSIITRPNTKAEVGHTVMTEDVSQKLDEIRENMPRPKNAMRSW